MKFAASCSLFDMLPAGVLDLRLGWSHNEPARRAMCCTTGRVPSMTFVCRSVRGLRFARRVDLSARWCALPLGQAFVVQRTHQRIQLKSGLACIGGDALNEAYRRVVHATNTFASGLRLDVVRNFDCMWFHDVVAAGLSQVCGWMS